MQCRKCEETLPEKGEYCPFCGERRTPPEPIEAAQTPKRPWTRWIPWAGGGVAVALLATLLVVLLWPRADWYIAKETMGETWKSYRSDGQIAATDATTYSYDSQGRLVVEGREYAFNEETGEYVNGEPEDAAIVHVYNRSCQLIRVEDYTQSVTQPNRTVYTYHTNGAIRTCTIETPRDDQLCRQVYTYTRAGLLQSFESYRKKSQGDAEERVNWVEYTYKKHRTIAICRYFPSGEVEVDTVITQEDDTHVRLTFLDGNYVDYTYNEDGLPIRIDHGNDKVYTYEWAQR